MILPFHFSPRQVPHLGEHFLDEDAVAHGGVVDELVGDGTDQLAVLQNGRARQVCGQ